jgi:drug/metabolite transporter (DMT)-like permease
LSFLPLADATAIVFISPLMITALSIPLLGEKVGIRRWIALCVGFVGVMVVIRPGTGAFNPAALLPLASATTWALCLVLTRTMHGADRVLTTLFYSTLTGLVAAGLMLPFFWVPPTPGALALMAGQGVLSTAGQALLIFGYGRAPASVLAPFHYSQMLWATLIGYFAFSTIPDVPTWAGAAIVIASGLYVIHRERVTARRRLPAVAATGGEAAE